MQNADVPLKLAASRLSEGVMTESVASCDCCYAATAYEWLRSPHRLQLTLEKIVDYTTRPAE